LSDWSPWGKHDQDYTDQHKDGSFPVEYSPLGWRHFTRPDPTENQTRASHEVALLCGVASNDHHPEMEGAGNMADAGIEVLFIAGFGPIDRDVAESRALYVNSLGISFKEEPGGYLYTGSLQGAKHFALWPLSQAAQSCFGTDSWPDNVPIPQAWLEFEVESVESATAGLESRGCRMLIRNRKEPWGQTVSRFLSPEGLLVGVTFTPSMRQ
jgi:hypothetical protein